MKKDSYGNDLPKAIFLQNGASTEKIMEAMVMTSFLISVGLAMQQGNSVMYDASTKTATITDHKGLISTAIH